MSSKTSKWLRKVLTHFYTMELHSRFFFLISPTIKLIIVSFPFDVQFTTFSFKYFLYSKFFLISFLQFFFIQNSSNWFVIQVTNNISPRNCIFNFTYIKNFLRPVLRVSVYTIELFMPFTSKITNALR